MPDSLLLRYKLDSLLLRYKLYSAWCSPEKVYLHLDRTCYTAGETIWFKGWVQEASSSSVMPPSNYLYAEVIDREGEAVVRVKVKRSNNGFPGYMELPDIMETGDYTLRAYTLWQLNGGLEYLFNEKIRIIGGGGKKSKAPKANHDAVEISFYPEGGRYFEGHLSAIGFKAVDRMGRSVNFTGSLESDREGVLQQIVTTHDGMGVFSFIPRKDYKYSVRDASGKKYPLPAPSQEGGTIQLRSRTGRHYVSALGFGGGTASLLLRDGTDLCRVAKIALDGKMDSFMLGDTLFRPGINHLLLVNEEGKILSERLFFIRDGKSPLCRLEMTRLKPDRRALSRGVISLNSPDGSALDGNCSVSVVRGVLKSWQQSDGITSYMGLSSEIRGRINDPYYYFDPDVPEPERNTALDMLMMIQGWRYYELEKILDLRSGNFRIKHLRELMQEVRGHITRRLSHRVPRDFTFTFMIPKRKAVHSVDVEKGREFIVDSLDFPENTEMLINIGTSRLGASYIPKWDGDVFAGPYSYRPAPGFAWDGSANAPILNEPVLGDTLQAAVITARMDEDDVLVFGNSYRDDLVTFGDLTLVEYLSMKKATFVYDGENMVNRSRQRFMSDSALTEDEDSPEQEDDNESGRVKLIVDDSEDVWWGYDMVLLSDLKSLSISTMPDPVFGGDGGVVHITLKNPDFRHKVDRNPSLLYFVPLGYQVPRYFSSPRYDQGDDVGYDDRNTVWWSPDVVISGGRAEIEFCNNDLSDFPYVVRIEGISADGRPFSRHCLVSPK